MTRDTPLSTLALVYTVIVGGIGGFPTATWGPWLLAAHLFEVFNIDYTSSTVGVIAYPATSVAFMIVGIVWAGLALALVCTERLVKPSSSPWSAAPALVLAILWMSVPVPLFCLAKGGPGDIDLNWKAPMILGPLTVIVYSLWFADAFLDRKRNQ